MLLRSRVAIATGGGRGIDRAMARALAGASAQVMISAACDRAEIDVVAE